MTSSSGLNSPEPMVADWEATLTKFTKLTPHLHYSNSSWRRISHRATLHGKLWGIVVVSTSETFHQQCIHEEANSLECCFSGTFHWPFMNEAHGLRTSGTQISKLRKAAGMMVTMDSHDYNIHTASYMFSLESQYKWMLMAARLVNGIQH